MSKKYPYDLFISYSHKDEQDVRLIHDKVAAFGFSVFWAPDLPRGKRFLPEIERALEESQHFVLIFTECSAESPWVKTEWETFFEEYHLPDPDNRRMHVYLDERCDAELVPADLEDLNRVRSIDDLIIALLESQRQVYSNTAKQLEEARRYYRRNRFWGPIVENGHVHVFTCGRDVAQDTASSRGSGGRTNIDMWDYRAVLDITHYFASNHPNARITIQDPISRLPDATLKSAGALSKKISDMRSKLRERDCIIVGSPDVNDFAEIALADIHQMDPYTTGSPVKTRGFVILKDLQHTRSSCYWQKREDEQEGIAQILEAGNYHLFPHEFARKRDAVSGKMYGILIVARNPYGKPEDNRKIVILSGYSGVATNAIAKMLTGEDYIEEFFKLDNAITDTNRDIEALVGVEYEARGEFENRDTRQIKRITFERLIEI